MRGEAKELIVKTDRRLGDRPRLSLGIEQARAFNRLRTVSPECEHEGDIVAAKYARLVEREIHRSFGLSIEEKGDRYRRPITCDTADVCQMRIALDPHVASTLSCRELLKCRSRRVKATNREKVRVQG